MNKLNEKRKKESQNKIEKAFLQLIQKKELEEIKVSEICKLASVNRSTFYANYLDIYDLSSKTKMMMIKKYASIYKEDPNVGYNKESFLKTFQHVKDNQLFYKTYFKLKYDLSNEEINEYDSNLATKFYNNENINYHIIFFKAGFTAILKEWLRNGCKESPETLSKILEAEYKNK